MRLWIWRQVRIEMPEDWEMLQFARDPQAGRCALADRYQIRIELHWQQVGGPPDVERLTADYLARLKTEAAQQELRPPAEAIGEAKRSEIGAWRGVEGREGGLWTSRFARYLAEESCLAEIVLLWPEGKDEELQQAIVRSAAAEPGRPDGLARWRAFGMDLLTTRGLPLDVCRADPGWARLAFADASQRRREIFERRGLLAEWLEGSVRDWLRRQTLGTLAAESEATVHRNGHAVETVGGRWRSGWLAGLLARPPAYEAAAWICPADGRLYHVTLLGPARPATDALPLAGGRLVCCEAMRNP